MRNDQVRFLKKLAGNESEHLRSALDDYIDKIRRSRLNPALSVSKFIDKKGGNDGSDNYQPSAAK